MREVVELKDAVYWDCPNCSKRNFQIPASIELTQEEFEEMREEYDIDEDDVGIFVESIKEVKCQFCNEEYDAEDNVYDFDAD